MKKAFRLEGLDCANCAAKMETAIKKISNVQEASVNFMTTKMTIECEKEYMDDVCKEAFQIVNKIEPDVQIRKA